ncbi:MAG: beta-N-acetylglucosaminidase domain-containing protein, partial [Bacteroides sp.]|nr:beta-N-acetylglucosaminidase domain-containing protein [Bacteroides sp.]
MKRVILASALGLFALQNISAQSFQIQPTPQEYVTSQDSLEIPHQISLITDNIQSNRLSAISLIKSLWKNQIEEKGFPVYLGIKGDKSIHKYKKNIPHKAEGYYLSIEKDKIVIAGADEQGLFYGVQTLAQLLTLPKLPLVQVTDYPDLPYRGVVEGLYGTPWSHDARLSKLEFYGKNKMNVYLYGPKD